LQRTVEQLSWEAVILPGARRAFHTPKELLPRGYVVQVPDTIDTHLTNDACYDLEKAAVPFSGDHLMIEALRSRNTSLEAADFVVVPFYQGRGRCLGTSI